MMIAVRNWLYTCFIELRRHVVDVVMSSGSLPDYFGRQLADTNCRPGNRMNQSLSFASIAIHNSLNHTIYCVAYGIYMRTSAYYRYIRIEINQFIPDRSSP